MKIVADKNIPFLQGIAEHYGDVEYLPGNQFTKEAIKDADTLIVRTVTTFNKDLLEGSNVKLICTATIGFDHIDTQYCDENGITWKNAPGCNSGSVMQYITSSLLLIAKKHQFDLKDKTIGIIGVGNVGSKVAKACSILGMKVLLNDPIRQKNEGITNFVDLETIKREANIITFHTPLSKNGEYPTFHLANATFFDQLSKRPIIINSARGGIVETEAIKEAIKTKKISGAIIDCWEKEPNIDLEYMNLVDIATPHIAGYSADGKANATRMSLETIANYWHKSSDEAKTVKAPQVPNPHIKLNEGDTNTLIEKAILTTYNTEKDHADLLRDPSTFSALRSNYSLRREYQAYIIECSNQEVVKTLSELGFNQK